MAKAKNKAKLVEKVAEETKVEAADLDRLPVEAIEKLDAIVPDEILPSEEPHREPVLPEVSSGPTSPETCSRVRLKGHHPITKEPVYL
jgi:hypothetical protein